MSPTHVTDRIPAYALGILDEDECTDIAAHLETCPECRAELHAYQTVVDRLPAAVPPRTPPRRLRAAILQAAVSQAEKPLEQRRAWPAWLALPLNRWAGLVGLVMILILGALNIFQWQRTQQAAAAAETFAEFRLVAMQPPVSDSGAPATGVLLINKEGTLGTLVVNGLVKLDPSQQQYQLWLIRDGERTSGGVFNVFGSGYGYLYVRSPDPLGSYTSFGVTIEPKGGSPGPTGDKVLGGSL